MAALRPALTFNDTFSFCARQWNGVHFIQRVHNPTKFVASNEAEWPFKAMIALVYFVRCESLELPKCD